MLPLPTTNSRDGEDYILLSSLNDAAFCPRRCALHRLENVWIDSAHTRSGVHFHKRVHARHNSSSDDGQKLSGLRLICHALCIQGVADLVEFHADGTPFPVEYKRGKDHPWDNDNVQLCAQALCLEEMTGLTVPAGAIYHIRSKRRRPVDFTASLRFLTTQTILKVRELLNKPSLPPPIHVPHCKKCSLFNLCLPKLAPSQPKYRQLADDLFNP